MQALQTVIDSGTLTSTKGEFVKRFDADFAAAVGTKYGHACSSGTAALHTAIAALDIDPGSEIVTSPITDMGAIAPILFQGGIPVFADVDPHSCNVTAETIEKVVTPRTRAIIVTHLFGNPCEMGEIMALANEHDIDVIEDCAQAHLASYDGTNVGALGKIGCFSLQQGKHITTGEGGAVVTSDAALARRMYLFINKAWGYGDPDPDHYFLALNYRMCELQGAVALAQLSKLPKVVQDRIRSAQMLTAMLRDLPGVMLPNPPERATHVYWKYSLTIDRMVYPQGPAGFASLLKDSGIVSVPRYIQKPAFMCKVIAEQKTFGASNYPFNLAHADAVNYQRARFAGTFDGLESILVLPWNEHYRGEHVAYIGEALRTAAEQLRESPG